MELAASARALQACSCPPAAASLSLTPLLVEFGWVGGDSLERTGRRVPAVAGLGWRADCVRLVLVSGVDFLSYKNIASWLMLILYEREIQLIGCSEDEVKRVHTGSSRTSKFRALIV